MILSSDPYINYSWKGFFYFQEKTHSKVLRVGVGKHLLEDSHCYIEWLQNIGTKIRRKQRRFIWEVWRPRTRESSSGEKYGDPVWVEPKMQRGRSASLTPFFTKPILTAKRMLSWGLTNYTRKKASDTVTRSFNVHLEKYTRRLL